MYYIYYINHISQIAHKNFNKSKSRNEKNCLAFLKLKKDKNYINNNNYSTLKGILAKNIKLKSRNNKNNKATQRISNLYNKISYNSSITFDNICVNKNYQINSSLLSSSYLINSFSNSNKSSIKRSIKTKFKRAFSNNKYKVYSRNKIRNECVKKKQTKFLHNNNKINKHNNLLSKSSEYYINNIKLKLNFNNKESRNEKINKNLIYELNNLKNSLYYFDSCCLENKSNVKSKSFSLSSLNHNIEYKCNKVIIFILLYIRFKHKSI